MKKIKINKSDFILKLYNNIVPSCLALTLQQAKGSRHKITPLNQKLTSTPGLFICGLCSIYADASHMAGAAERLKVKVNNHRFSMRAS